MFPRARVKNQTLWEDGQGVVWEAAGTTHWHFIMSSLFVSALYFCLDHKAHKKHRPWISQRYAESSLNTDLLNPPSFPYSALYSSPVSSFVITAPKNTYKPRHFFPPPFPTPHSHSVSNLGFIYTPWGSVSAGCRATGLVLSQALWFRFFLASPLYPLYQVQPWVWDSWNRKFMKAMLL